MCIRDRPYYSRQAIMKPVSKAVTNDLYVVSEYCVNTESVFLLRFELYQTSVSAEADTVNPQQKPTS